jgi:hypothetical protein
MEVNRFGCRLLSDGRPFEPSLSPDEAGEKETYL